MSNLEPSLMDQSISIVILLFILSLISERLINWIKLCFFKKINKILWITYSLRFDYSKKSDNEQVEKIRERKIIGLNIICSIAISMCIGANFFEIIVCPIPYEGLTLITDIGIRNLDIKFFIGTIVTGLFMSMGSKFWHDTLDMLFAVKSLRQKASDPNSYKVQNIEQLKEYVETSNYEIVKLALEANKKMFCDMVGVNGCGIEYDLAQKKYVIVVHQDKSETYDKVESHVQFSLRHGQMVNVPVLVLSSKIAIVQGGTLKPSFDIANANYTNNMGSIGCFLMDKDKNKYLLTCYHCVIDENQADLTFNKDKIVTVKSSKLKNNIGQVDRAFINDSIDAALIKINPDVKIDYRYSNNVFVTKILSMYDEGTKVMRSKSVYIRGIKSSFDGAKITGINYSIGFDYSKLSSKFPKKHYLENLIGISYNNKPVTKPGDSGCPVFDTKDFAFIGIVIGADDNNTYVIPADRIIYEFSVDGLNLELLKN